MSKTEYIKLLYPNDTTVTIQGDQEIISQIVRQLDGQMIGFEVKEQFDITYGWDKKAIQALLDGDDSNE